MYKVEENDMGAQGARRKAHLLNGVHYSKSTKMVAWTEWLINLHGQKQRSNGQRWRQLLGVSIGQKEADPKIVVAEVSQWIQSQSFQMSVSGLRIGRAVIKREGGGVLLISVFYSYCSITNYSEVNLLPMHVLYCPNLPYNLIREQWYPGLQMKS